MVRQVYWSYTPLRLDAATTLTVTVSGKYQKTLLFERNETGRINYFDDYILQTLYNSGSIVLSKTDIESNLHSSEPRVLKKSASRYISYLVLLQTTKTQEKFH